jgi:hypothetical protein
MQPEQYLVPKEILKPVVTVAVLPKAILETGDFISSASLFTLPL